MNLKPFAQMPTHILNFKVYLLINVKQCFIGKLARSKMRQWYIYIYIYTYIYGYKLKK